MSIQADDPYGVADAATLAFWTTKRMAAATPLDGRPTQASSATMGVQSSRPTAHTWTGSPVVGALFSSDGNGSHYCTASVVDTPKKSLILTAAHCVYGTNGTAKNIAFVPRYSKGSRPYGVWPVGYIYVDKRWKSKRDPDLDFGFATIGTRNGKKIANVVGSNRLVWNQGYTNRVRVIGYPMKKYASVDKPIYCTVTTHKAFKYQIRFDCNGYYGGTSGSPWIKNYNTTTRRGDVLGVIGGYQEGGKYDWRSYSSVFDKDIKNLFTDAKGRG
ncbi:trypsin-like peptidase domain-containing protein [Actinoallomurus purpureus]|uniref:trypsin-like serine peptidase n=1 Tax=Actinoallomurus purpureus TaxID=478114 RepID=UPI002093B120|nr:trypsin-like peptidase domain-containing protein [Actinoallomurus purpureus]MCO6004428.1 trypsin-like peptidase domain-containing protein [Actinoallomurus purpureus]